MRGSEVLKAFRFLPHMEGKFGIEFHVIANKSLHYDKSSFCSLNKYRRYSQVSAVHWGHPYSSVSILVQPHLVPSWTPDSLSELYLITDRDEPWTYIFFIWHLSELFYLLVISRSYFSLESNPTHSSKQICG